MNFDLAYPLTWTDEQLPSPAQSHVPGDSPAGADINQFTSDTSQSASVFYSDTFYPCHADVDASTWPRTILRAGTPLGDHEDLSTSYSDLSSRAQIYSDNTRSHQACDNPLSNHYTNLRAVPEPLLPGVPTDRFIDMVRFSTKGTINSLQALSPKTGQVAAHCKDRQNHHNYYQPCMEDLEPSSLAYSNNDFPNCVPHTFMQADPQPLSSGDFETTISAFDIPQDWFGTRFEDTSLETIPPKSMNITSPGALWSTSTPQPGENLPYIASTLDSTLNTGITTATCLPEQADFTISEVFDNKDDQTQMQHNFLRGGVSMDQSQEVFSLTPFEVDAAHSPNAQIITTTGPIWHELDDDAFLEESRRAASELYSTYTPSPAVETPESKNVQSRSSRHLRGRVAHRNTSKDDLLVQWRQEGKSYKEIRRLGAFDEAESTLRGRYRALTKNPEERLRRPPWTSDDVS